MRLRAIAVRHLVRQYLALARVENVFNASCFKEVLSRRLRANIPVSFVVWSRSTIAKFAICNKASGLLAVYQNRDYCLSH